jgi:hypothetical protein
VKEIGKDQAPQFNSTRREFLETSLKIGSAFGIAASGFGKNRRKDDGDD